MRRKCALYLAPTVPLLSCLFDHETGGWKSTQVVRCDVSRKRYPTTGYGMVTEDVKSTFNQECVFSPPVKVPRHRKRGGTHVGMTPPPAILSVRKEKRQYYSSGEAARAEECILALEVTFTTGLK